MKLVRRQNVLRAPANSVEPGSPVSLASLQVTAGPMLCQLRIWTEQEWDALAECDRPIEFVHVPGLGWLGALPVECLN